MSKIVRLPGLVDVHTHLREPGAEHKEDFATGTKAAISGGYTAIFDMPNNPNPVIDLNTLEEKIEMARGRIYSDVGFHFGGAALAIPNFEQVKTKVFGLKVYMNHTTGDLLIENINVLEQIWASWPKNKVIMVHAEGPTLEKAINLTRKHGGRLHVCHLSQAFELDQVREAKEAGLKITCEVSCHHLFLTDEDIKSLGSFGMMKPPLSSKEDVEYLWKNLDVVDMVASDHAPHTLDEKKSAKPPFGVPGLETSLPLMLNAVNQGKLTVERLVELTNINPSKLFGLDNYYAISHSEFISESIKILKQIQDDGTSTFVEVDLDEEWTIKNENLFTKAGWTPFDGLTVKGKVKRVVLRGKEVYNGEEIFSPYGEVIFPR